MRTWNPSATPVLTGSKMYDWKVLSDEFLASLIVSDERAAEIMRLYPEDVMTGRPGLFAPSDKKLQASSATKARGSVQNTDEELNAVAEYDEMELAAAG
jgi:hypothetical protein